MSKQEPNLLGIIVPILLTFICEFSCWGLFYSFSMFYSDLVVSLRSNYVTVGAIIGIVGIVGSGMGTIPAKLVHATSYSSTIFFAGILIAAGLFSTSFDDYVWEAFLSFSLCLGIASALGQVSLNYLIEHSDGVLEISLCAATTGTGFGIIIFSEIAAYLYSYGYSWRWVFRYFAIMGLLTAISSVGYISTTDTKKDKKKIRPSTEEDPLLISYSDEDELNLENTPNGVCGWTLLMDEHDWRARKLFLSHFLLFLGSQVPINFSIVYIITVSPTTIVYFIMPAVVGGAFVLSRIANSTTAHYKLMSTFGLTKTIAIGCFITSLALALISVDTISIWLACLLLGVFAFFQASLIPTLLVRTIVVLGKDNHLLNIGVQMFTVGLGTLAGSVIAGAIYDTTYDFFWIFLFVALTFPAAFIADEINFPEYGLFAKAI